MQLLSELNIVIRFLLCVTDIYSKYVWVISLKDRQGITITNAFKKIIRKSGCKPKKIWVDKGKEFSSRSKFILIISARQKYIGKI